MIDKVKRPITEPIRERMSWSETWKGTDHGLIRSWERGREMRKERPELAEAALRGELPPLPWKGGIEGSPKFKSKYGVMKYLALWQGLRNEDLDVPLNEDEEESLTCSRTGVTVRFTRDFEKYKNA